MDQTLEPHKAIEALVAAATQRGIVLTRTTIAKFLYFADLRSIRRNLGIVSGVPWVWENHGPFASGTLYPAIDRCVMNKTMEVERTANFYGTPEYRYKALPNASSRAAGRYLEVIDEVLEEYGQCTPTQLRDLSYETVPMKKVQATGQRNDPLDMHAEQRPAIERFLSLGPDHGFSDDDSLPKWREKPGRPLMRLRPHPLAAD